MVITRSRMKAGIQYNEKRKTSKTMQASDITDDMSLNEAETVHDDPTQTRVEEPPSKNSKNLVVYLRRVIYSLLAIACLEVILNFLVECFHLLVTSLVLPFFLAIMSFFEDFVSLLKKYLLVSLFLFLLHLALEIFAFIPLEHESIVGYRKKI